MPSLKITFRILPLLALVLLFAACEQKQPASEKQKIWDRNSATAEYQLIQTELQLSDSAKPYLVINGPKNRLEIRLKGSVVWNSPLSSGDEAPVNLDRFLRQFEEEGILQRAVTKKYLFAATEKNPDSVLAIVSKALDVDQSLLQREVPSRFQLNWGDNLVMDVSTSAVGKPASPFKNTLMKVGQALKSPFGEVRLVLRMDSNKAVTFWRVMQVGVPTLVISG
jgi:hypothetical protein